MTEPTASDLVAQLGEKVSTRPGDWKLIPTGSKADLQFAALAVNSLPLVVKALEGQGLLLDCLETVCVALPDADRFAADDFIEQMRVARSQALATVAEAAQEALP